MGKIWREVDGPWLPGMLARRPHDGGGWYHYRLTSFVEGGKWRVTRFHLTKVGALCHADPADPATLGAMLGEVRRVWGEPRAYLKPMPNGRWGLRMPLRRESFNASTEAEVLALAYAAAPKDDR